MAEIIGDEVVQFWDRMSRAEVDHNQLTERALEHCSIILGFLRDILKEQRARYRYLAQRISDAFWLHNQAHRTDKTPGYPGHYGCRVRLRGQTLEMSWYYNIFVERKEDGKIIVLSRYIPKEGRYKYYRPAFNRAQDWERPVIEDTEKGFQYIRQLNGNLGRMARIAKSSERLLTELEEFLERVTKPLGESALHISSEYKDP